MRRAKTNVFAPSASLTMPRFEIDSYPITVAYGYEDPCNVFLSVYDNRLRYDSSASPQVNDVTRAVGSGDGCFFEIHTGSAGFGQRVDNDTMVTFLGRFGVTDEQINAIPLHPIEVHHVSPPWPRARKAN